MKQTKILMGMPITVEVVDKFATLDVLNRVFSYFKYIDRKFSTYKKNSEMTKINGGKIKKNKYSRDMQVVFLLSEKTKRETNGYFNIFRKGKIDPSGLVKGWAIYNAAKIIESANFFNYYINAGGDIQTSGVNHQGNPWRVGIKNPFNGQEIIKVLNINGEAVATSGTYERGQHIYNPNENNQKVAEIVSITVIGPNIYNADRFATAAFAMGKAAVEFIESKDGFEGYMIDEVGQATATSGFEKFTRNSR